MPNFQVLPDATGGLSREGRQFLDQFNRELRGIPVEQLTKHFTGKMLWVLHDVCGLPLEAAWRMVRPSSKSTGHAAEVQASRWLNHYRRKNPAGIADAFEASGITIQRATDLVSEMMNATKWVWDEKSKSYKPTDIPDWSARNRALGRVLDFVKLDTKVRDELTVGRAEHQKMQLNTGIKFDTIQEWTEWMEGRHQIVIDQRREAARDMKLIAAGRRIIQEQGQEAADKMRQAARDAGLTGDEPDEDDD